MSKDNKSTEIVEISPELEKEISLAFAPKKAEIEILQKSYTAMLGKPMSKELVKEARALRLKIKDARVAVGKIHTTQKAFFLAAGRLVDTWKNKESERCTQMEDRLEEAENYYVELEKKKMKELYDKRVLEVSPFTTAPAYNLNTMDEATYQIYRIGLKAKYEEDKRAAEEAEAKRLADEAEAKRLAEIAQKEKEENDRRIREENDRLRKQNEELERQQKELERQRVNQELELKKKIEEQEAEIEKQRNEKEQMRKMSDINSFIVISNDREGQKQIMKEAQRLSDNKVKGKDAEIKLHQLTEQIKHELTDAKFHVNDDPSLSNVLIWHALQKGRNDKDSFFDVAGYQGRFVQNWGEDDMEEYFWDFNFDNLSEQNNELIEWLHSLI